MAQSLDIILQAKDQFSGPMAKLDKGMKKTDKSLKKVNSSANLAASAFKKMGSRMLSVAGGVVIAQTLGRAMRFLAGSINEALDNAIAQDKANRRVAQSLEQMGLNTRANIKMFTDWASVLQTTYGVADDLSLSLASLAMQMGYTVEESKDMVEIAQGLAGAYGMNAKSAMEALNKAMDGRYAKLEKLIPELASLATNEEKWNLILEKSRQGLDLAAEATEGLGGSIEQLKMAWGDFTEAFVLSFSGAIQGAMSWMTKFVISIPIYTELFILHWARAGIAVGDTLKHVFTSLAPAFLLYLGISTAKIFANMALNIKSVFEGVISAISRMFGALLGWLASGMAGGMTALATGMGNAIKSGIEDGMASANQGFTLQGFTAPEQEKSPALTLLDNMISRDNAELDAIWAPSEKDRVTPGDVLKPGDGDSKSQKGLGNASDERFLATGRSVAKSPEAETAENTRKSVKQNDQMINQIDTLNGNFEQFMDKATNQQSGGEGV